MSFVDPTIRVAVKVGCCDLLHAGEIGSALLSAQAATDGCVGLWPAHDTISPLACTTIFNSFVVMSENVRGQRCLRRSTSCREWWCLRIRCWFNMRLRIHLSSWPPRSSARGQGDFVDHAAPAVRW